MGPAPPFDVFKVLHFYFISSMFFFFFSPPPWKCVFHRRTHNTWALMFKKQDFFSGLFPQESILTQCLGGEMHFKRLFFMEFCTLNRSSRWQSVRRGKGWTQCYRASLNWRWYIYASRAWTHELRGTFGSSPLPPLHPAINWFDADVLIYVHPLCWPVSASACLWMMNKNTVNEMAAMLSKLINGLPI